MCNSVSFNMLNELLSIVGLSQYRKQTFKLAVVGEVVQYQY